MQHLILRKSSLSEETLQTLDFAAVAKETQGYTPQDLVLLLERAVHANIVQNGQTDMGTKDSNTEILKVFRFTIKVNSYNVFFCCESSPGVCLSWRDFEQALKGFTPPSLWGVDLHTPSEVGLERVGGLKEVRQQLMDTILLPAKVSATTVTAQGVCLWSGGSIRAQGG